MVDYSSIDIPKLIRQVEQNCELVKEQNHQNLKLIELNTKAIDRLTLIIEGDHKLGIQGLVERANNSEKHIEKFNKYIFAAGIILVLFESLPIIKEVLKFFIK